MFKKFIYLILFVSLSILMVSCGETTTLTESTTESDNTTTAEVITLPDLSGYSKSEIISELNSLDIDYIFEYETNQDIDEDYFINYGGEDQSGMTISEDHEVVIIIATSKLILPDLLGENQLEMYQILQALNIQFVIEIVTDNTVADQTFSSYGSGLVTGDLVPSSYEVTVNLGYNSATLPVLTGKIKEEIIKILTQENILYEFAYIVNDSYSEDSFESYEGAEAGDFYEEGVVTINLYKNTFTDNETSLIISKYVDGGDATNDQAIEIYNPTTSSIDLSRYHLAIYKNGSLSITYQIEFDDIDLAPGETYVIANNLANGNIQVAADKLSEDLLFDGNDTIQLCYENGTYIDTIYSIGNRDYVMDNEVFIRIETVVSGTREYIFNQWYGFVPTYVGVLGTHPVGIPTQIDIEITTRDFYDPLGGMDLVTLVYINDGDTASFTPGFLDDERVRFLGVDTPETWPEVQAWGQEGKDYTTLILNNAVNIYIQSDPEAGYTETYGRHLGLVWVDLGETGLTIDILNSDSEVMRTEHLSGWILLNYHLVLNGYSYNYYGSDSELVFNDRYLVRWFQEAEKFAADNGLGIHE
ncbi:MAG: lamin tail domain-containing protein [Tenericutes bacterium]|nr:lamin tail domain-containing protein [Mycoplasmatota bacterium]